MNDTDSAGEAIMTNTEPVSITGRNPDDRARTGRQIRRILSRYGADNTDEPEDSEQ